MSMRESVVTAIIEAVMDKIRIAGVGTVTDYDHPTAAATVQPLVLDWRRVGDEREAIDPGPIEGVPVMQLGGAKRGITFGLDAGDLVLLIYRSASHDAVDGGGRDPQMPDSHDRMGSQDLIAIPLMSTPSPGLPSGAVGAGGAMVIVTPAGEPVMIGNDGAQIPLARADRVDDRFATHEAALNEHFHIGVTTGQGVTGIVDPSGLMSPGQSTACESVLVRS